ncbi:ATP-dependent helicase HrpB [Paenibacillus sp. HB172176]|uniref:ATP-dependent helicase HrpB n=1 Tax=Paenibacillus sp. HB172176 TaxID=2493690 RepID=UPI00143ABAA3|nr:ATP-dependent helicase HrpB [Paenibacillus sp. HB172176]
MYELPIEEALPSFLEAMRSGRNAVLVAEPGAGKTTRVPLALLQQPWLNGKKIIMLEPRRLAARAAAGYMARLLGEKVGETAGYRVRLDARISPATRIEVITEGILTRMLQKDPALEGVGIILFDEFHERHLHGDLGLALSLQAQALLREDLRIAVMSATLQEGPLAELLGDAPVIRSAGRHFPVATHYAATRRTLPLEQAMAQTIMQALHRHEGDVLAFLPGMSEIRRTARRLEEAGLPTGVSVRELHGSMTLEAQSEAVASCAVGKRKIVLATSIAESSLTVDGVRIVVDSGLMRVSAFSPRSGLSRLETAPVSKASADQRRGRAGRQAPGVCYRLWTQDEQLRLPDQAKPEIAETDLSSLALELAVWGVADPGELDWLTPPPIAAYKQALTLLSKLGAIDGEGKPTGRGRRIANLGLSPRLGSMLLRAADRGYLELGCRLAALLSDRDLLGGERRADLSLRLQALDNASREDAAAQRVVRQAQQWEQVLSQELGKRELGLSPSTGIIDKAGSARESSAGSDASASNGARKRNGIEALAGNGLTGNPIGSLLAHAYPDRIAQRRQDGRFLLSNGRGAVLRQEELLSQAPYLVVCELDDGGGEARIQLAESISQEELERELSEWLVTEEAVEWDAAGRTVRARERLKLGVLLLRERPLQAPDEEAVADALMEGVALSKLELLPMTKQARSLQARMALMHGSGEGDWPDASDEALLATLDEWLRPHVYGKRSYADLQKLKIAQLLEGMLSWKQKQRLDEQVPTHWTAPSGSRVPIDYSDPQAPFSSVRLQELFGLQQTPRLAGGTLPLTLHLLSPSQRPVQVTQDLASFWANTYFEVKKDLKGRYPKHYWPDDPNAAIPTNRVKPRHQ